jgi:hypothetical protein
MQSAARRARRRQEIETSDEASGVAGKTSATERNERYSERRGGQVVGKRKKRVIQRASRRASRRQKKETSDSASGTAGKPSARVTNERCCEGHSGLDGEMTALASGVAGELSTSGRLRTALRG